MDELKDFKRGGRGGDNRYGKRGVHVQYTFKGLRRGGGGNNEIDFRNGSCEC